MDNSTIVILIIMACYLYGVWWVINGSCNDPRIQNDPCPETVKIFLIWIIAVLWPPIFVIGTLWRLSGYFVKEK